MPPSPRYTLRLPPALDARVKARLQAGTPFAVLVREALSAYLADTPPTPRRQAPTETPTDEPTGANISADTLRDMQEQLTRLTKRMEVLEQELTPRRQAPTAGQRRRRHHADTSSGRAPTDEPTPADTLADLPADRAPTALSPSPQILGSYDRAAAVARMQVLRREGLSFETIAKQLTAEGIMTRYGLPWEHSSVRYLLRTNGW